MWSKLFLGVFFSIFFGIFNPVKGAETIEMIYTPLSFSLDISSLENFANTGEINAQLRQYTKSLDEESLAELRKFLSKKHNFSAPQLRRITNTSIGRDLLKQLGKVVSTHSNRNGFYPLRSALVTAGNQSGGWTVLDVLRAFPQDKAVIDLQLLISLKDEVFAYQGYREKAMEAIASASEKQAQGETWQNLEKLPNLSKRGRHEVMKETVTLDKRDFRQTQDGFVSEYSFDVDFYFPRKINQPSPIIIISHGFGSLKANFVTLGEHLASHGFVVAIPEHIGSNLAYREEFLQGGVNSALSPVEFLARPKDLSYILDKMTDLVREDGRWAKIFDLNRVGILGDSLGGTTVLSMAGAPLNIPRLQAECQQDNIIINIALIVQCQGSYLPPSNYNVRDNRVKAVIATHPLTSAIFGVESMAKIDIPVMITAGSNDIITPVILEQIHPFLWLKNSAKHLLLYQPGTHFSSGKPSSQQALEDLPDVLVGKNRDITSEYFLSQAVAFFEVYLRNNKDYLPYLSARYGQLRSNENLTVNQLSNLSAQDLTASYGKNPPVAIIPPRLNPPDNQNQSIIDDIKSTGVLKVAFPQNVPPFGFVDGEGRWGGYCGFLTREFTTYLQEKLNLDFELNISYFPVSSASDFDLVKNNQVHFECGTNVINSQENKVTFSVPFFVTGNHFLVSNTSNLNPNQSLNNYNIAVVKDSRHNNFIRAKYPQAKTTFFDDVSAGLRALEKQEVDGLISDGILLSTELNSANLSNKYQIIPKLPLTCNYYGLVLPQGDSDWVNLVNNFLNQKDVTNKYFSSEIEQELLNNFNYCLNYQGDKE